VIKTAKGIQQKLDNVLTYFIHRITKAVAEGINSKIQTIKKAAYGFRSFENFKTAIFFHCGGLRLYPVIHGKPGLTGLPLLASHMWCVASCWFLINVR